MVHHIVMWKFRPEVEEADKARRKAEMEKNLSSMV